MNIEQLKQNHPETYNSIFNSGVAQERERVESWMDYADTNLDEVKHGITSGKELNNDVEEFYQEIDSRIKNN